MADINPMGWVALLTLVLGLASFFFGLGTFVAFSTRANPADSGRGGLWWALAGIVLAAIVAPWMYNSFVFNELTDAQRNDPVIRAIEGTLNVLDTLQPWLLLGILVISVLLMIIALGTSAIVSSSGVTVPPPPVAPATAAAPRQFAHAFALLILAGITLVVFIWSVSIPHGSPRWVALQGIAKEASDAGMKASKKPFRLEVAGEAVNPKEWETLVTEINKLGEAKTIRIATIPDPSDPKKRVLDPNALKTAIFESYDKGETIQVVLASKAETYNKAKPDDAGTAIDGELLVTFDIDIEGRSAPTDKFTKFETWSKGITRWIRMDPGSRKGIISLPRPSPGTTPGTVTLSASSLRISKKTP